MSSARGRAPHYVLQARNRVPPLQVAMEIDSHQLLMEVDTGAAYSLISDATFKEFWPDRRLEKSDVRLCTYSGGNTLKSWEASQ